MARSGIPGVTERAVQYVQNALLPGQSEAQATATFTRSVQTLVLAIFFGIIPSILAYHSVS